MKNLVFEFSKIVTLLATIGVGALSLGPGWSVFMDDGAQAAYFLERKRDRLDKACRATPDSIALHGELATVCEELGLWSDAFRCREKLIALEPASAKRYRDFADSLSAMRSDGLQYFGCRREEIPERVIALYQAAVMRAPRDESLAREFAMTFYSLGGGFENEAIAAWRHSLEISASEQAGKEAHLHLARWLSRSEGLSEARWHLQQAEGFGNDMLVRETRRFLATVEMESGVTKHALLAP